MNRPFRLPLLAAAVPALETHAVFHAAHGDAFLIAKIAHTDSSLGRFEIEPRGGDQRRVVRMKARKFIAVARRQKNITVAGADARGRLRFLRRRGRRRRFARARRF